MGGPTIPLFPLGSPLFPGMVQQLHIFEPRYRQLVADLLQVAEAGAPAVFGIVAIREGYEVGEQGAQSLAEVGCAADLRGVATLPDGRFELMIVGFQRFRLDHILDDGETPYLRGSVDWIAEDTEPDVQAAAESVRSAFASYRTALSDNGIDVGAEDLPENATLLSYAIGAALQLVPSERQQVLAAPDTAARLQLLQQFLSRERTMLGTLHAVPATKFTPGAASWN